MPSVPKRTCWPRVGSGLNTGFRASAEARRGRGHRGPRGKIGLNTGIAGGEGTGMARIPVAPEARLSSVKRRRCGA